MRVSVRGWGLRTSHHQSRFSRSWDPKVAQFWDPKFPPHPWFWHRMGKGGGKASLGWRRREKRLQDRGKKWQRDASYTHGDLFPQKASFLFGGQMKQISGFSPQNAPLGSSRPTIPLHTPQTHTKHPPDPGKFATASPATCPHVRQPRKHCGVLVFSLKSLFFTSSSEQTHPFLNAWKTPSKLGAFPYSSKQL